MITTGKGSLSSVAVAPLGYVKHLPHTQLHDSMQGVGSPLSVGLTNERSQPSASATALHRVHAKGARG
jgi:hypothetical protein